jgi:uncharacterized protein (TIGR03546 family)
MLGGADMFKILPRPIGKFLAILRGQVSPVFVFLSVLLGFWFGLMPGWSGLHTVLVVVVLVLNIHIGLFLLSAGIGKALCFAAAPILFHVGAWVQDYLSALLKLLASVPVIGVTDFNRYSLAGALVIGPVVGGIAGLLLARAVIAFRRKLLKFEEGSEKFRKWYSNRWVRILDRLLIGKRTKDAKAMFSAKTKVVRKAGVILAAVVVAVAVFAASLLKNDAVKNYATKAMTRANGAEVDIGAVQISPVAGAASVSGIEVTDPEKLEQNQVAIGKVAADISLYDLLLGRLVMEDVQISDVKFDQLRATPGKPEQARTEQKPPVFDPCDFRLERLDMSKIETYFKNAKAVKQWLQDVKKWLPAPKAKEAEVSTVPQGYLEYLNARAPVPVQPRILAKQALLDKVNIPSAIFGESAISLQNVSDSPGAARLPVTLKIKSNDTSALLSVTFDYSSPDKPPAVSGSFDGFQLSKVQDALGPNAGLAFSEGIASGSFSGLLTSELVDLAVNISVRDMKAQGKGDGILGLGSETTSEALAALQNLNTTVRLVGPTSEPRAAFDVKGLNEQFKSALVKAGRTRLANEIDKQLGEKLGDKVPEDVKDVLKVPQDLTKRLGDLFGGKSDEKK